MTSNGTSTLEELLQFLYLTPVGIVKFRADGAVDLMNPMASALLLPLTHDDTLQNIYAALAPIAPDLRREVALFTGKAGTIIDQRLAETQAGGKLLILSLTVNRVDARVYMAVLKDVTKLAEQERKLFADGEKFRAIFDNVHDYAIYTINLEGIVEEWNQSMQRYAGWLASDVEGQSIGMFFPPDDPSRPPLESLLASARRVGSVETEGWRRKRDGSRLWGNTIITALPDETGAVRGFVVVSRDMTERKRLEDEMKRFATVDPLTGAYNRRQGHIGLATEFGRYARSGRPFSVMMLDIDHFKTINDRFGHAAGDAVLCALVQTCKTALRSIDLVVRWGGEEFLLVLPETDATEAMAAAERLRAAVEEMRVDISDAAPIGITISIGVAVTTNGDENELVNRSDVALYTAKTGGRNRVVLAA